MKHIFILNDTVVGGGAEIVMQNLVMHLHDKYKITVMTFDGDKDAFRNVFPHNVDYMLTVESNPYGKKNPFRYFFAVYRRIKKFFICRKKYDIVIANKEGPCMKFVSQMNGKKKLAWVHVDYQNLYWTHCFFTAHDEVKCMKRFDNVICVSETAAQSVKKVIGDPGNLCVKYNPINYLDILKKAEEASEIARDNTKPLFVAVGRLVEQKNFITLVRVCSRLCKEYDFELWIVGDGEQRRQIEQVLEDEDCACVKILGMQTNPYKYLAKADFCISTSLGESYGLVIQEAAILNVPVLATRCPAIEECFSSQFGILVDCDEVAIEQGMKAILEHPECIGKYKENIKREYCLESLWQWRLNEIEKLLQ